MIPKHIFAAGVCAALALTHAFCTVARADAIRYELQIAGTLPGNPAGKVAPLLPNGSVLNLEVFMLAQGDDGNPNNDALKFGTGFISSSNGGLLGDLGNFVLDPQFNFQPGTVSKPGVQIDRDGDGDLDLGNGIHGSLTTTTGFLASIDIPANPNGLRDGTIPAATLGTTGDDWSYARILKLTFTINDPLISPTDTTQINFDPRQFFAGHQVIADGTTFHRSGAPALPVQVGAPIVFVPEPATIILFAFGALGFTAIRPFRRQRPMPAS